MRLSSFGEKFTNKSGILILMDDLGKALSGSSDMLMLGGGNPAHIPEVQKILKKRMQEILENDNEFEKMIGNYTTPQGDSEFLSAVAEFLHKEYSWKVSSKNICVLHGSQTTFFFLFNMLAGKFSDGSFKKILLPIVPEYIGYEDQGISSDFFTSAKPKMEFLDDHTFKYKVDFDALKITKDIAAICISRPTNPTGNVITDEEVAKLSEIAKLNKIPLIIDNAYGQPFPNILFSKATPSWNENTIFVFSLSKLGMPSTRTSIVIANEEIISHLTSINAIISLSTTTIGQRMVLPLLKDNSILEISNKYITPFYQKKSEEAVKFFHSQMDPKIPYFLHKSEGALFLWLWCKDLPITSQQLYERLKKRGVLVVSGHYFFAGQNDTLKQKHECIRITYSQNDEVVKKGLKIIADELKTLYN